MGYVAGRMAHEKEREQKKQGSKRAREQRKEEDAILFSSAFFARTLLLLPAMGRRSIPTARLVEVRQKEGM